MNKLIRSMSRRIFRDFALREKLGGGNFGLAYAAIRIKPGETAGGRTELSQEQKRRRVVLKRVNMDKSPDRLERRV